MSPYPANYLKFWYLFLQSFDAACVENKGKLDSAAKARGDMEKPSNTENMVDAMTPRWDTVKKVAEERVEKVSLSADVRVW